MIDQPLNTLMDRLGITNAQLVEASTEQLSFKMVQKGRKGKRITPNIQAKIFSALMTVKPDLKIRRRDLFRYDMDPSTLKALETAIKRSRTGKIKYPQFVELLDKAGVTGYQVEVAKHEITYYGIGGEAHTESGPVVSTSLQGIYNEPAIRAAIGEAQKGTIDYLGFLQKIYAAGVIRYDVNIRDRIIKYRGESQSYKETIGQPTEVVTTPKKAAAKPKKKPVKNKKKSLTRKARLAAYKRYFTKKKRR